MSILVRLGTARDLPTLVQLHQVVHELHLAARPDHFTALSDAAAEARFRDFFVDPSTTVWVAEAGGSVCGYLVAIVQERAGTAYTCERRWCELDQVAVASDARQHGVARALVRTAVTAAREAGVAQIELTSWAFNQTAQRAFRRLGFAPKTTRFELAFEADPGAAAGQPKR